MKIVQGLAGGRRSKEVKCGRPKSVKTIDDRRCLDPRKPLPKHVEEVVVKIVQHKMESCTMLNNYLQFESAGLSITPIINIYYQERFNIA